MTPNPAYAPLTDDQLQAVPIEVRWEVLARHKTTVTLLEVLSGLDINEEDWRDEDGNCRFTSVQEALSWAMTDGFSLGWAEDWVSNMETPRTEYGGEVDTYAIEFHDRSATAPSSDDVSP